MSLLFGLRRVSQSFNTLIRHCPFAHRRFTTQSPTDGVLFFAARVDEHDERRKEQYFYSAKIEKGGTLGPATWRSSIGFERFDIRHVRYCNGLICLLGDDQVHIFNPDCEGHSTHPFSMLFPDDPWLANGFEPHLFFGFDPLSNKHKVLLVHTRKWRAWILTLGGGGSWRQIHPLPRKQEFLLPEDFYAVVYANGAIHWLYDSRGDPYDPRGDFYGVTIQWLYDSRGKRYPPHYGNGEDYYYNCDYDDSVYYRGGSCPSEKCIVAFDMTEEQFRKIPRPDDSFPGYLAEFGGRLALIEDFGLERLGFDVVEYDKLQCWVLEDYNNHKWVKETIHFPFAWMRDKKFLSFDNNTGEMLLKSENFLLYYNTKTGVFRTPELTGLPRWCSGKITQLSEFPGSVEIEPSLFFNKPKVPKRGQFHREIGDGKFDLFALDATFSERKVFKDNLRRRGFSAS